ncbi:MAG: hypothetical protein Q8O33_15730 [Pseudomonadota bacterium]|nr:hypothetical protein [Pseudomonadota bacterium]
MMNDLEKPTHDFMNQELAFWLGLPSWNASQAAKLISGVVPDEVAFSPRESVSTIDGRDISYQGNRTYDDTMFMCNASDTQDRVAIVAAANKIETASPQEWIALSESVGMVPPWKEYAIANGMLPERRLKVAEPEKLLTPTERNTLLTIIAALCKYEGIDPQGRGAAQRLMEMTDDLGAHVDDGTIRNHLAKIPDALETRMK